jgi:tetratricopeptide (TPR) repeat protein
MSEDLGDVLKKIEQDGVLEWKNKGNQYYKTGDYGNALLCYGKALDIEPENLDVLNNAGLALVKLNRISEAKQIKLKIEEIKQKPPQQDIKSQTPPPLSTAPEQPVSINAPIPKPISIVEEKNPSTAGVCSFFIPGLGQVYNGEAGKGLAFLIITPIATCFFLYPGIVPWLVGMYDAYTTAKKMNSGKIQTKQSSTVLMVVFIVIGFVAMLIAFTIGSLLYYLVFVSHQYHFA